MCDGAKPAGPGATENSRCYPPPALTPYRGPRTPLSLHSAPSLPGTLLTSDEGGRAFGGPAAAPAVCSPLRAESGESSAVPSGWPVFCDLNEPAVERQRRGRHSRSPPCLRFRQAPQPLAALPRGGCSSSRRSRTSCWSTARLPVLPPNVRAEATRELGRPWAAQDNGACDCPARPKGTPPRGVASRARG